MSLLPTDLRELYAFILICETGSMTAAAQRMNVTQSAVSQLIRQLEADLEVTLFDRDCRPMAVTPAGERLRQAASELIKQAEQLPDLVRGNTHKPLSSIRLGFVDSFASALGAELINALENRAHSVSAWSGLTPSLTESLTQRQVDLIVTTDPMENQEDYESIYLFRDPFVLVLPPDTELHRAPADLHSLAKQLPLIRYSARSTIGQQVARHLRRLEVNAPIRYEFDATFPLLKMVQAGLGWAISTPLCLLGGNVEKDGFYVVPLPGPPLFRSFQVSSRRGRLGKLPETVAEIVPSLLRSHHLSRLTQMAPWLSTRDFDLPIG